ncbi:hypothetical protein FA13DRAFT_1807896 [Coprinellus micaceus]|uniref:DUF6533 domain-containing protein n=1 Tax=Coprinellus micaceus TaxID=71717 RepID=A0A4Y7TYY4_COPMI|nr:hypothetical protein FA13DRAFT_1807896 [Coprinellus micaceus]
MSSTVISVSQLDQLQTLKFLDAATLALLAVEYIATLPLEVRLIWPTRMSYINILYFLNRHVVFISVITTRLAPGTHCTALNMVSNCARVATVLISEALLFARVWALSGSERRLGYILVAFWVVIGVVALVLIALYALSAVYVLSPYPGIIECIPIFNNAKYSSPAVAIVFLEQIVIMSLSFYYGIRSRSRTGSRLAKIVYRDGLLYFVALTLIAILNAAIQLTVKGNIRFLLNPFHMAMHSILATRMVLHLRDEARLRMGFNTHLDATMVSTMQAEGAYSISLQPINLKQWK